jgi:hypothetical protein
MIIYDGFVKSQKSRHSRDNPPLRTCSGKLQLVQQKNSMGQDAGDSGAGAGKNEANCHIPE